LVKKVRGEGLWTEEETEEALPSKKERNRGKQSILLQSAEPSGRQREKRRGERKDHGLTGKKGGESPSSAGEKGDPKDALADTPRGKKEER